MRVTGAAGRSMAAAVAAMLGWRRPAAALQRVSRRCASRPFPAPRPPCAAPAPPRGSEMLGQGHSGACGGDGCAPSPHPCAARRAGGREPPARAGAEGRELLPGW